MGAQLIPILTNILGLSPKSNSWWQLIHEGQLSSQPIARLLWKASPIGNHLRPIGFHNSQFSVRIYINFKTISFTMTDYFMRNCLPSVTTKVLIPLSLAKLIYWPFYIHWSLESMESERSRSIFQFTTSFNKCKSLRKKGHALALIRWKQMKSRNFSNLCFVQWLPHTQSNVWDFFVDLCLLCSEWEATDRSSSFLGFISFVFISHELLDPKWPYCRRPKDLW